MTPEETRARRPVAVTLTARDTSLLQFPSGKQVEMQVRGAICWPTPPQQGGDVMGYAVLGGLDMATGVLEVLEESAFITIPHVLDETGLITVRGLVGWCNMAWQTYAMQKVFWHQDEERYLLYKKQVNDCAQLQPKPRFVELFWQDDSLAEAALLTRVTMERLRIYDDAPSYEALQVWKTRPGEDVRRDPAVWALCVLAAGFGQRPWRGKVKSGIF